MHRSRKIGWVLAVVALLAGVAFGYLALRPLPRDADLANPDAGYLIVDSVAAAAESLASPARQPTNGSPPSGSGQVLLDTPQPNQLAESPLWVVGRARGTWFFEAEFPVRLLDQNDSVLTWGSARANGEWMTSDYVPFALTLNFNRPTTDMGTLVLEKSNPSGLPRSAASVRIPLRFR